MVGIVLVSHSRDLAEAACRLALQAVQTASIVGVGGTGDDGSEFGTDAIAIKEAIEQLDSTDGILLLMDMGSAILSAETALDLLDGDIASRVVLSSAPLVEGAVAAVVQSSIGADIETVRREALTGLQPKQHQLNDASEGQASTEPSLVIPDHARSQTYIIGNRDGLHARPAAVLVQFAAKFDAEVYFGAKDPSMAPATAKSLNAIAKLNLRKGDPLLAYAWGNQAAEFLNELEDMVLREFGERELSEQELMHLKEELKQPPAKLSHPLSQTESKLLGISRGMAMGQIWKMEPMANPVFPDSKPMAVQDELVVLDNILNTAVITLNKEIANSESETTRSVLEMHKVMMQDPDLLQRAQKAVSTEGISAEQAWWNTCQTAANEYRAIKDNELLNARADDLVDMGLRVLSESSSVTVPDMPETPENSILFTEEITPGIIAGLIRDKVKGIVTRFGGATSHAAIIARSEDIPMISGYAELDTVTTGTTVLLNANAGTIVLNPEPDQISKFSNEMDEIARLKKEFLLHSCRNVSTLDGEPVECAANIGRPEEADNLIQRGADGIGLFRSEFLFMDRQSPPKEMEQYDAYSHVLKKMEGRSVIIRTMDIGGDKPIPYFSMEQESNPFLGLRGIRFALKYEHLFREQLRALLQAGVNGNLKIMIPMVVDSGEIRRIRDIVQEVERQLEQEGKPFARRIPLGIMVETPASVLLIANLAKEADFFCIGSNDLTQYILAAERGNKQLTELCDVCHPAVLWALKQVVEAASSSSTPLSICGEAGADFEVVPLLLGMGIRKLSASPSRLPALKHLVSNLSAAECRTHLPDILSGNNAGHIRRAVREQFPVAARLASLM